MMISSRAKEYLDRAKKQLATFDFVRFATPDFHGRFRGRSSTAKAAPKFVESGISTYIYNFAMGIKDQDPIDEESSRNSVFFADPTAIFPLPWATEGELKVAMVLGTPFLDGKAMDIAPRYIAEKQLHMLHEIGISLMSSFEIEFMIQNEDGKPLVESAFQSIMEMSKHEKFIYNMCKNLQIAGVDVDLINFEFAEGQLEITLEPCFGMQAIDKAAVFKSSVKEMCYQSGYEAFFMTHPFQRIENSSNGSHYNHSLWNTSRQCNLMYDDKDPNSMSSTYKHWLAGLIKHGPALAALCCPTVNCYRRLHKSWTPGKVDWGIDSRDACFRVKTGEMASTYLENRLPSSAFNPYLAVAGTIASGLDGIRNKLELDSEMAYTQEVPHSLEDALVLLENDQVLVQSLGKDFVEMFCFLKRKYEITPLEDVDITDLSNENLARERDMYCCL